MLNTKVALNYLKYFRLNYIRMDFEFESIDAEVLASRRLELYPELQVLEF